MARRFDLTVVDQAEPGRIGIGGMIIESALFDSDRPVIIVPCSKERRLSSIA
jgi:hypothetical protein